MSKRAIIAALSVLFAVVVCARSITPSAAAEESRFTGCPGDCNSDGAVHVHEIIGLVNIILGMFTPDACPPLLGFPDISDVLQAVNSALEGCPPTPFVTATPTETPLPTPTPVIFDLGEGSSIAYSPPPAEGGAVIEEVLEGEFAVQLRRREVQFFIFDIVTLNFRSPQFIAVPQTPDQPGSLRMSAIWCPALTLMEDVRLLINKAPVSLLGEALAADCAPNIATIGPFELCPSPAMSACEEVRAGTRAGYALTIVPVPRVD